MAQDVVITDQDCGTKDGLFITSVIEGGDVVLPLGARVLGRTVAQDIHAADGKELLIERGTLIDEAWVERLDEMGIDEMWVRSAITAKQLTASAVRAMAGLARGHLSTSARR